MSEKESGTSEGRLARFHRIRKLADNLTIGKRFGAAAIAAFATFPVVWFGFEMMGDANVSLFWPAFGAAAAAAFAAFTLRPVAAVAYGFLATLRLMLEAVAIVFGAIAGALG